MAQIKLEQDLNRVQKAPIELTLLDGNLNIIQKLADEPNDADGLTASQLKAKFDEAGNIIKTYINETLIPEVETEHATELERARAEGERVSAEAARAEAEVLRATAETERESAEGLRATAETERESAEAAREAAETARADETAGIVARAIHKANAAKAYQETAKAYAEGGDFMTYDESTGRFGVAHPGPLGAKGYAEQARAFSEGGKYALDQEGPQYEAVGARSYADMAKAYAESGSFETIIQLGWDVYRTTGTVEKGAKQYAQDAAKSADTAKRTADGVVTEEAARVNAEKQRATAENARAEAEARREDLETGYIAAAEAAAGRAEAAAQALETHINDASVAPNTTWSSQRIDKIYGQLCNPLHESGPIATCYPVPEYPLGVISHIEPLQESSGELSPANPRPIKGWTGAKLTRCGKNYMPIPETYPDGPHHKSAGIEYDVLPDGTLHIHGTQTGKTKYYFSTDFHLPPGKFTRSYAKEEYFIVIIYVDKKTLKYQGIITDAVFDTSVWDYTQYNYVVYLEKANVTQEPVDFYYQPQIERGSTKSKYEPSARADFTIDFGQTVYGGTYDWGKGELTSTLDSEGKPLPSPLVTKFPPQEIISLSGQNNLFSDTGNTTVTAWKNPAQEIVELRQAILAQGGNV